MGGYHWYFLAQPRGFPERLIGADPEFFLRHTMGHASGRADPAAGPARFSDEAFAEYLRCFRDPEVIHATCEDYRAGATIDFDLDAADLAAGRRIQCPMLALWGERGRRREVIETWQKWATDVRGRALAVRPLPARGGAGRDAGGADDVLPGRRDARPGANSRPVAAARAGAALRAAPSPRGARIQREIGPFGATRILPLRSPCCACARAALISSRG